MKFVTKDTTKNVLRNVLNGSLLNPLISNIKTWQEAADYVPYGGIYERLWTNLTAYGDVGKTIIYPNFGIRQTGTISSIKINIHARNGATWKLKIFRYNISASLYDFVGESSFVPTTTGIQTFDLTPINVQYGDIPALYTDVGNYPKVTQVNYSLRVKSVAGDISDSNAFDTTGTTAGNACMELYGQRPYIALAGGSTMMGANQGTGNKWFGCEYLAIPEANMVSYPGGNIESEPFYWTKLALDSTLNYQNHALSTNTYANGLSLLIPNALATHSKFVILGFGSNDLATGRTWAQVLSDLDAIKILFDASSSEKLLICDIAPRNDIDATLCGTLRTWNTNIAQWCTDNLATLVPIHDELGQVRIATGYIDDLKTEYSQDGIHLTLLGVKKYAEIMARFIE